MSRTRLALAALVPVLGLLTAAPAAAQLPVFPSGSAVGEGLPLKAYATVTPTVHLFGDLVTAAVLIPVVWLSWRNARSLDIMSTISLGLPLSIFAYSIPVTGGLMVLHTLRLMIRRVRMGPDSSDTQHVG